MTKRMMIFIPGIKGSELWEGNNKRWFPRKKEDLYASTITNVLRVDAPLSSVNAFGVVKTIYEYILDCYPKEEFDFHAYDWRKPIGESVGRLVNTIKDQNKSGYKVYLVAHSMGGLLAKLAVKELEEQGLTSLVSRLITIGTPWRGAPDAFKVLSYGEPGLYSDIFQFRELFDDKETRDLARQFPSVYQLLPSEEYYLHQNETDENAGKFIAPNSDNLYLSYYEILGKIQRFYIEAGKITGINEDVYLKYMKPLQEAMLHPLPKGLEHDCLIGCNFPTLHQMPVESSDKRRTFKGDCKLDDGDSVVPLYSATPPHEANTYYVSGQHSDLMTLTPVLSFVDWCFNDKVGDQPDFIYDAPLGNLFKKSLLAKIMCPVDTTILDNEGKFITGTFDPSVKGISDLAYDKDTLFLNIGESKYVFIRDNEEESINLKINSYDFGVADISIKIFDDEENYTEVKFDPLPVNSEISAELNIPVNSNLNKATLKSSQKTQPARLIKKTKDIKKRGEGVVPVPKLSISIINADEVQKALYRKVFSGDVVIRIETDADELIEDIYYIINEQTPIRYEDETIVNLKSGEYNIRAIGKDIYNRPTLDSTVKFKIDDDLPETKIIIEVNPEGLLLSFKPLTQGAKTKTFFKVNDKESSPVSENEIIPVAWGKLLSNRNDFIEIEYYSENEFGSVEDPKKIRISLGDIGLLMWEDYSVLVTPEVIWGNVFKHNDISMTDVNVFFIGKNAFSATLDQRVPDNVKGVKFQSRLFEVDVMYDEKYSLFFTGPPTEVLKIGQVYDFTFELIAERSKERILHSKPEAHLVPIKSKLKNKKLDVYLEDGIFKSQFVVDGSFFTQKYKLVISDIKNTSPALREIPLTLGEEEQK